MEFFSGRELGQNSAADAPSRGGRGSRRVQRPACPRWRREPRASMAHAGGCGRRETHACSGDRRLVFPENPDACCEQRLSRSAIGPACSTRKNHHSRTICCRNS